MPNRRKRQVGHQDQIESGHQPDLGARILVVDDNEALAKLLVKVLKRRGYTAIHTQNGNEAIRRFASDGPFDLVISDMLLPSGFNGDVLAKTLLENAPELRVIFLSGSPLDDLPQEIDASSIDNFLLKPVPGHTLIEEVARVLKG